MIAKSKRLSPIPSILFGLWSASVVAAPPENSVLTDKFRLIWSNPTGNLDCTELLLYLKEPTVYDPNDIARSLLASSRTLIWQFKNAKAELVPPEMLGDIYSHRLPEALLLDLDGNGSREELARVWNEVKGQRYNQLFVSEASGQVERNPPYYELLSVAEIPQLVGPSNNPSLDTRDSFRLFELVEMNDRPYVIALDTVWPGDGLNTDRIALVFEFRPTMTPILDCALQTKIFSHN